MVLEGKRRAIGLKVAAAVAVVVIVLIWREWSWRSAHGALLQRVADFETEIAVIHANYKRHMESHQCTAGLESLDKNSLGQAEFELPSVDSKLLTLFDWKGLCQWAVYSMVMVLEMMFGYSTYITELKEDKDIIPPELFMRTSLFLSHRVSYVTLAFHSILWLLSSAAWIGLIQSQTFIYIAMKMIVMWALAQPVAYVTHNFFHLMPYLPKSFDSYKVSSTWMWIGSKLIALDNPYQLYQICTNVFFTAVYMWPYRYAFFYSAAVHSDAAKAANFITNMILHSSMAWIWLSLVTLLLLGPPTSYIRRLVGDSGTPLIVFTGFQAVLALSYIIRVFIFTFSQCNTWYSMAMGLAFLNVYILIFLAGIVGFNAMMQRYLVIQNNKEDFIKNFVKSGLEGDPKSGEGKEAASEPSPEVLAELNAAAKEIFEYVLDKTCLNVYFMRQEIESSSGGDEANKPKDEHEFFLKVFDSTVIQVALTLQRQQQEQEEELKEQQQQQEKSVQEEQPAATEDSSPAAADIDIDQSTPPVPADVSSHSSQVEDDTDYLTEIE